VPRIASTSPFPSKKFKMFIRTRPTGCSKSRVCRAVAMILPGSLASASM